MRNTQTNNTLALVGCFLLLSSTSSLAESRLTGRVVGVADGDTLTLLDSSKTQHKIRLSGIDSPERHQAFGNRAKQALASLSHGRQASAVCPKKDRYGRWVCVVTVDGHDVGLSQIENGLAWWYRQYARDQTAGDRQAYEAAELAARAQTRGLWSDSSGPVPPWEWRRAKREKR